MRNTPAIVKHLAQLVARERTTTLPFAHLARLVGVLLYLASLGDSPDAPAVRGPLLGYAVVAAVVAVLSRLLPRALTWSAWVVAVVDLPMVAWLGARVAPVNETASVVSSVMPFSAALLFSTTLALSRRVIVASTLSALACSGALMVRLSHALLPSVLDLALLVLVGALCLTLVARLSDLVEASRRRDFAGRYLLGARLGAGAMAEVFEALYTPEGGFERKVAVKRVLPARATDEALVEAFRREAELGARLAHPNLVQVLDFGRARDSWFLAMEFVDGPTLATLVQHAGEEHLPVSLGLFIVCELAEGLSWLHAQGLVHCDLSPPNVLLSRQGEVKLADFGLAQRASRVVGRGRGRTPWVAPEVLLGAAPTPLSDLFSLGVIAHELLSGRRLFAADTDAEAVQAVCARRVPRVRHLRPEVSETVDELVAGLLERDPEQRVAAASVVTGILRGLTGPRAPWPSGRPALIAQLTRAD